VTHLLTRIIGVIVGNAILLGIGALLVWLDRRTDAPIMKERINSASERFLTEQAAAERETIQSGKIDLEKI
jgi:hypothetical protein